MSENKFERIQTLNEWIEAEDTNPYDIVRYLCEKGKLLLSMDPEVMQEELNKVFTDIKEQIEILD